MKVLVIGGTGVISTAVAQQLLDRGDEVTILNRGRTPVRLRGAVRRLCGDRGDRAAFAATVRDAGPWDCVVDMICGLPDDAQALADACRGRATQVLFCSTTNVYPKPADAYPVREDHRLGAAFQSGVDKAACEGVHRAAAAAGAYAVTIVRPGHTYGEGGGVLHSLGPATSYLDRIRLGLPIVVHGDGRGQWSALHAEDVARVFVAAAGNPAAYGRAYNATGTERFTWDEYNLAVAAALGVAAPPLVHVPVAELVRLAPERAAQVARSLQYPGLYDSTRARDELGVTQRLPLAAGLRRTIAWLAAHDGIAPAATDPDYDRILRAWQESPAGLAPAAKASG